MKREIISHEIKENLMARSREFYIDLSNIALSDLTFGGDFMKQIEKKQIAQQDAITKEFEVSLREEQK
jgi:prohibitin 2